ncbi:MAG: hydrogenase maturation protease [Anaerolineales bacterium]|jgi:hydrogenase maturation protease
MENNELTKRNIVIGLGNPILGDDGVGWRVVQEVESYLSEKDLVDEFGLEFKYLSLGGLSLMEQMVGYKDVLVVDSIVTGQNPIGSIYSLPLSRLPNLSSEHSTAIHDTSLQTALEVGRKIDLELPQDVWVVAVEAERVYDFSEDLSPQIADVVPIAVNLILEMLKIGERIEKLIHPEEI